VRCAVSPVIATRKRLGMPGQRLARHLHSGRFGLDATPAPSLKPGHCRGHGRGFDIGKSDRSLPVWPDWDLPSNSRNTEASRNRAHEPGIVEMSEFASRGTHVEPRDKSGPMRRVPKWRVSYLVSQASVGAPKRLHVGRDRSDLLRVTYAPPARP